MTEPTISDVIELRCIIDPATGQEVWSTDADAVPMRRDQPEGGTVRLPHERFAAPDGPAGPVTSVSTLNPMGDHTMAPQPPESSSGPVPVLPVARFAGAQPDAPDPWAVAPAGGAPGRHAALSPTGEIVVVEDGVTTSAVQLPRDKFAAPVTRDRLADELAVWNTLRDARVSWIQRLQPTRTIPGYPANGPDGWLFLPRPNRYGDQLVCVLAHDSSTGMYHAHFWQYEADIDDRGRKSIDLPRVLGRNPHLTQHGAHLYTRPDGTAVLCLSENAGGGMPDFRSALVQTLKWADGTGEVVRGRRFPYQ